MDAARNQSACTSETTQLARIIIAGVLSSIASKDACTAVPDEVAYQGAAAATLTDIPTHEVLQNLPCGRCRDLIRGVPCSQDGTPMHSGCVDRSRSFLQLRESPDGEEHWELVAGLHRFSGLQDWMRGVIEGAAALPRHVGETLEETTTSSRDVMLGVVDSCTEIASDSVDSAVSTSKGMWNTAVRYTDLAESKIDKAVSASTDIKNEVWHAAVEYKDLAESKIDKVVCASKDMKDEAWHTAVRYTDLAEGGIDKAVSAGKDMKDRVGHKIATGKETVCQAVTNGTGKFTRSVTAGKDIVSQAVGTGKEKVSRSVSSGKTVIKTLPEKAGKGKAAVSGAAGLLSSRTSELMGVKMGQGMSSVRESVTCKMQAWKTKSTGSAGGA